jgi:hypothetical protein
MARLRFENPPDIPAHWVAGFKVYPSRITLRTTDMIKVLAKRIENHYEFLAGMPKHRGSYKEFERISELHENLRRACQAGEDLDLDSPGNVRSYCAGLMFKKRFVSIECLECKTEYTPRDCSVLSWESFQKIMGKVSGSRGRRIVCPEGHTLYSYPETIVD